MKEYQALSKEAPQALLKTEPELDEDLEKIVDMMIKQEKRL